MKNSRFVRQFKQKIEPQGAQRIRGLRTRVIVCSSCLPGVLWLSLPRKFGSNTEPRWSLREHLLVNRARLAMRARQVPRAHQELVHDLAAGEDKGLLEHQAPLVERLRMM